MSADAAVSLAWGDGEHRFRLAIGGWIELQEKCNAGPQEIYTRVVSGTWRVADLRETLRIGLIGGGMTPIMALTLVERYVDARPLFENIGPAQAILAAGLAGAPGERPGETSAETTATGAMDASSSPLSTAPAS